MLFRAQSLLHGVLAESVRESHHHLPLLRRHLLLLGRRGVIIRISVLQDLDTFVASTFDLIGRLALLEEVGGNDVVVVRIRLLSVTKQLI